MPGSKDGDTPFIDPQKNTDGVKQLTRVVGEWGHSEWDASCRAVRHRSSPGGASAYETSQYGTDSPTEPKAVCWGV
jgi:hypothetical protein